MEATNQRTPDIESLLKTSHIELDHMTSKLRNLLGQSDRELGSMPPRSKNDRYQSSDARDTWTNDRFSRARDTLLSTGIRSELKKPNLEHSLTQKNFRGAAQLNSYSNVLQPLASSYNFKDFDKLNAFARPTKSSFECKPIASSFRRVEEAYLSRFVPPSGEMQQNVQSYCPSPANNSQYHVPRAFKQCHRSSSNQSVRPSDNTKTRETIMVIPYQLKNMKQDLKDLMWSKESCVKENKRPSKLKSKVSSEIVKDKYPSKVLKSEAKKPGMKSTRDNKFFLIMRKEEDHKDIVDSRSVNKKTCQKVSKCVDSKALQKALKDYFASSVK